MTAITGPKAKGRPGPYSKQRDIGYGSEESNVDEAQQEARTNPYYAPSESSRDAQPLLDPPTEDQRMLALSLAYSPGSDTEPMVVSISPSDAGWQANLEWLGQMEGANMVLDQLCSQVFWPIPTVLLGGLPVWKSQDGTMYWLFVQNPRDKAGWYLTTTPVLDLAQLAEELLLATLKIYSPELFGRCHFHFGFIRFLHEPHWLFI